MMRLGICGNGMIVHHFLSEHQKIKGLEVKAVCGRPQSEDKLRDTCEKHGIPGYYLDTDEMLAAEDIDTVYVAVPNHLHYEYCKKALNAGKHVICEKPFTSNLEEAEELIELALSKKLVLIEAVTTHYFPNTLKIKERLPELGNIKIVIMNYSSYSSRYDAFRNGSTLPAFDPAKSGGALMDINIYNVNFLVNLFGEPENVEYYPNIERNIDTSGVLILAYESFKCVAIGTKDCRAPISASIEGDEGYITISTPVNLLSGFKYSKTKGTGFADEASAQEENYNSDNYHLYHEFVEFERIIRENDYEKVKQMLDISLIVMKIQTEARKKAGIVFKADK